MVVWFWIQRLDEEILRLNHLRDRASEKGRRKEYPLLYEILVPFRVLVLTMLAQLICWFSPTIFCINATFENTLKQKFLLVFRGWWEYCNKVWGWWAPLVGMYLMSRLTTKDQSHFPENSTALFFTCFFFPLFFGKIIHLNILCFASLVHEVCCLAWLFDIIFLEYLVWLLGRNKISTVGGVALTITKAFCTYRPFSFLLSPWWLNRELDSIFNTSNWECCRRFQLITIVPFFWYFIYIIELH